MNLDKTVIIKRHAKSTKECFCGAEVHMELNERTFVCPLCGYEEDRDIKAAKIIKYWGENNQHIISKKALPLYHLNYESQLRNAGTITTD